MQVDLPFLQLQSERLSLDQRRQDDEPAVSVHAQQMLIGKTDGCAAQLSGAHLLAQEQILAHHRGHPRLCWRRRCLHDALLFLDSRGGTLLRCMGGKGE